MHTLAVVTEALDRRAGTTERLDRIWEDLAGLRADLTTFTTTQEATNAQFRDHVVRSEVNGVVHTDTFALVRRDVDAQASRLRALEDAHIEIVTTTRTVMRVVSLTLGASVLGIVLMLLNLWDLASHAAQ